MFETSMQWFGESWGAPVCRAETKIPTPVGEDCGYCDKLIGEKDHGIRMPYVGDPTGRGYMNCHHMCFLRAVLPEHMIHKGQA